MQTKMLPAQTGNKSTEAVTNLHVKAIFKLQMPMKLQKS